MLVTPDPSATTVDTAAGEPSQLSIARAGQTLIAEAKALLMQRHGIDADEALELLRRYSRGCDLPMRDVAQRLVHDKWLPAGT